MSKKKTVLQKPIKIEEIPEPYGSHPYQIHFMYAEDNPSGGLPYQRKKKVYYSGKGKGCHDKVERQFMKDYKHLKPCIISVRYWG